MAEQDIPPPTITAMKIPIIRKGEYDIWSMRMRQYICHTDHNLWDVIINEDLEEEPAPTGETSTPLAPKTAKQLAIKRNQERVKSILLLAIPDEYLLKFHNVADAKSLWEAIKSRFGGNEESKKMQKNVLKHQFENFTTASNESLDKAYDRFQKLISQLEVHGAPISKEDINQKFLRSLPPLWNQIALIMRNKPDIDEIDIDDLYNNLRVYEDEMKRSSSSTSTSQNLAFLSSENTSSTNEVSTASGDFGVSTAGGISQVSTTLCAHDVACSFFAQPTTSPQLENEDFQQIDEDDLEELDLRWQSEIECYNYHKKGTLLGNADLEGIKGEDLMVIMVAQDGLGGYDWSNDFELEPNYDSERENHSRARLEIQGYELALELLESRILVHEKNELAWGEKYEFQNYALKCKEIKINNLNLKLEEVVKERDELKLKIEKWEESSKNLDELLNSQMSARDKTSLGYGTQLNQMSNNCKTDSEISLSVFDVRSSDEENTPANDRFSKVDEFHVVPPLITGNFLTPRADISFAGETNEVNTQKPKTVYGSVNRDKVIIEDWNSDDEDDVSEVQTVSPAKTNETQTVKTRVDKIGQTSQKQGIGFKKIKACFVCKSIDHLIKDYNFHDKHSQEPKLKTMVNTSPRVDKPVWDNTKRVNHQNLSKYPHLRKTFVPSGVLTRTGLITPVKVQNMTTAGTRAVVNTGKGKMDTDLKSSNPVFK
ncbi:hypothetical protein Tco_1078573 [Tanacetum coccineum]|uniref:Uncharacterized protein n=1 Tax=Tanacetum coccineum TaxID=301880 RepID=A0ABQ5HPI6_9ASTR